MAGRTIDPDSRHFVVLSPDENGVVVGKFDTQAEVHIPDTVGEIAVIELDGQEELDGYEYDYEVGFQHAGNGRGVGAGSIPGNGNSGE